METNVDRSRVGGSLNITKSKILSHWGINPRQKKKKKKKCGKMVVAYI